MFPSTEIFSKRRKIYTICVTVWDDVEGKGTGRFYTSSRRGKDHLLRHAPQSHTNVVDHEARVKAAAVSFAN